MNATLFRRWGVLALLIIATLSANRADAVNVFTETFDGAFDNTWTNLGDGGSFLTNGFGEQVLAVTSFDEGGGDQDGVSRLLGAGPFEAVVEVSNIAFDSAISSVAVGIIDNGGDDEVFVGARGGNAGSLELLFGYGVDDPFLPTIVGFINVGTGVERITFKLAHEADTVNGGGIYEAFYDLDESGSFTSLGTIDGTQFTNDSTAGREFILQTLTFDNTAYAEFDFAEVTAPAVPEPGTLLLGSLGAALVGAGSIRRRRSGKV